MLVGNDCVVVCIMLVLLDGGIMIDEVVSCFGGGGFSVIGVGKQSVSGMGVVVVYECFDDGIKVDIGIMFSGFKYFNVVGGVSVE